jgi:hypothetical protein
MSNRKKNAPATDEADGANKPRKISESSARRDEAQTPTNPIRRRHEARTNRYMRRILTGARCGQRLVIYQNEKPEIQVAKAIANALHDAVTGNPRFHGKAEAMARELRDEVNRQITELEKDGVTRIDKTTLSKVVVIRVQKQPEISHRIGKGEYKRRLLADWTEGARQVAAEKMPSEFGPRALEVNE